MSATYTKIIAMTEKEARVKAEAEVKNLGIMRQPSIQSVRQLPDGTWIAEIKYWGLD